MESTVDRVTVPQAAERMGKRGSEVYDLIFRGELDAHPFQGRGVLVTIASIERWLADHTGDTEPADG